MRIQLLHLSGPKRGDTITYPQARVALGAGGSCVARFPASAGVVDRHAEIEFIEPDCAFHLRALDGQVFVNGREVREIILEHADLIELGVGGPKLRFRIQYDPGAVCKPVRQMLSDAVEVGGVSGIFAAGRSLRRDLIRHSSLALRIAVPTGVVLLAFGAAYLGGAMGTKRTTMTQEELRRHERDAIALELSRMRDQLRRQQEEFRVGLAGQVSRAELDDLRADLLQRAAVVDTLVAHNAALQRVLDLYSRGVCLIHGAYTFRNPSDNEPVKGPDGSGLLLEYMGTGFLVSSDGVVLTNRHVVEPWWNNDMVSGLVDQGLVPSFVRFAAYFPGRGPMRIDPGTIHVSAEGVDIAMFRLSSDSVKDVPVLPRHSDEIGGFRGARVILLGYPTGLNAVLARAEPDMVTGILASAHDTESLLSELADRSLIAPVITQGALNEVLDRRLVYDAETTSGGSGGPVFGPDGTVIGVNFAITRDFDGSNFGVPIGFARPLLESSSPTPSPTP